MKNKTIHIEDGSKKTLCGASVKNSVSFEKYFELINSNNTNRICKKCIQIDKSN